MPYAALNEDIHLIIAIERAHESLGGLEFR